MTAVPDDDLAGRGVTTDFDHHDPHFHADRHQRWQELRRTCPVAWNPNHGGFWAVAGYDEVTTVSRDNDVFSSKYEPAAPDGIDYIGISGIPRSKGIPPAGIAEVEGPHHAALRRAMNPFLLPAAVAEREDLVRDAARWFLDEAIESGSIDLVDDYASPVPALLTMAIIGLPLDDWRAYAELFHATIARRPSDPLHQQAIARVPDMLAQLREEAERRRRAPRDDLLSALVALERDGRPLDDDTVTAVLWNLVGGGVDTTASLTSLSLLHLAEHPDQRQRLIDEPDLLPAATEEFLRYFSVNESLSRTVARDTELGGVALAAGDRVLLSWLSANRDETRFPDPDTVVLDRAPNPHIAFGVGAHRCIGMHVARSTFQILVGEVLDRIPDYTVAAAGPPLRRQPHAERTGEPAGALHARPPARSRDASVLMGAGATGPAAGAAWAGTQTVPDHVPTVAGLLRHALASHPDNLAVAAPDQRLRYADLERRSASLAARLVSLGVGKGTRVGILLPNDVGWVVAWAAITRIGAIATPVNTFSKTPELATMLRHADVQVLIATPEFAPHDYAARLLDIAPGLADATAPDPLLLPALPQLRHVLLWDEHAGLPWASSGVGADLDVPVAEPLRTIVAAMEDDVVPADPMLITYTSGSTGEPKGVVHGNGPLLRHARNLAAMSGIGPDDRIWTPMPLCWVGGFSFTLLRALSVGAAFVTQPRLEAGVALELLERERVTCVSAWPSIGATLTAHPDYESTDLSALRLGTFYEGRAPEHRPDDPSRSVTSLGMSETGGPHTFWTLDDDRHGSPEAYAGAFGHEVPGVSHRIVDADGNDVPEGTEGEVLVRGYSVMLGLYKHERAEVFDADGWYHTGDRGLFRDGWFFFTGRQSDLIKTKGSNVAPAEVERALAGIDGVKQAYVFGVDHPERGQDVVALVVSDGDAPPPDDEPARIATELRDLLSSYKLPRHIILIDAGEVPFLTSQKPDRRRLAAMAAERARTAVAG